MEQVRCCAKNVTDVALLQVSWTQLASPHTIAFDFFGTSKNA